MYYSHFIYRCTKIKKNNSGVKRLIFMYGIPLLSVNGSKVKTSSNQLQFAGNDVLFSVCYYSLPWWTIIRVCFKFKNV